MKILLIPILITLSSSLFSQQVPNYKPLVDVVLCKSFVQVYKKLEKSNLFKGTITVAKPTKDSAIIGLYQGLPINVTKFQYYSSDTAFVVNVDLGNKKRYESFVKAGRSIFLEINDLVEPFDSTGIQCGGIEFRNQDPKEERERLDIKIHECPLHLIPAEKRTYNLVLKPFREFRCGNEM